MATISENIHNLFEQKNIKKVIYVDNEFERDVYKDSLFGFLRDNFGKGDVKWPFPVEVSVEIALMELEKWIANATNEEFDTFIATNRIERLANTIEQKLSEVLPDGILTCVTPSEFTHQYVETKGYSPSETNQLLILMDKYLDENDPDSGLRRLSSFKDQEWVSCGLFSDKFSIENEIDQWKNGEKTKNVYPLSKRRVSEGDCEHLLPGIRNVIWLSQISEIKHSYITMCTNAVSSIEEYFNTIDPASFDKVIMTESSKEGCWEYETMHRVGISVLESKLEDQLTEDMYTTIQKQFGSLRTIKNICPQELPDNTELAKEIMSKEQFAQGIFINKIYSPISNGDIFKIGNKLYILLCQPCNLEIRGADHEVGKRKAGDYLYLIPIESFKESKSYTRPIEIDSNKMMIRYSACKLVSSSILDLVSFCKTGEAICDIELEEPYPNTRPNMAARYDIIRNYVKEFVDKYRALDSEESKKALGVMHDSIMNSFKNPQCKGGFLKAPVLSGHKVDFKISRVMRLKDPYAQAYLQEFMSYLSRPAFPLRLE
ncbi:MAG: hypothetical protein MJY97_06580 [Bacteroidales bacterium]|nr:hypothetical protein [Bacteroidales bacterium]